MCKCVCLSLRSLLHCDTYCIKRHPSEQPQTQSEPKSDTVALTELLFTEGHRIILRVSLLSFPSIYYTDLIFLFLSFMKYFVMWNPLDALLQTFISLSAQTSTVFREFSCVNCLFNIYITLICPFLVFLLSVSVCCIGQYGSLESSFT